MKRRGIRNRIVLGLGMAAFLAAAARNAEAQDCSSFPDPSQCPALGTAIVEVDDAGTAGLQRSLVEVDDRGTAGLVRTLVELDDKGTTGLQMVLLEIDVRITNVAPIADATPESQNAIVGNSVTVSGTASSDPDMGPSPLSFSWSVVDQPAFSAVSPPTGTGSSFTFVFDRTGDYKIRLTVSDGAATATDDVVVQGFPAPPVLMSTPPTTCLDADSASFSGTAEPGSQVEVYRAGAPSTIIAMASALLGTFTVSNVPLLEDAPNFLRFRATKNGRSSDTYSSPAAFNLTEDSTAPTVVFSVPQNGDQFPATVSRNGPNNTITLQYNVTDAGCGVSTIAGDIDGAPGAQPGTIVDLFNLGVGPHTLTVNSQDVLGHPDTDSVTFTVVRCLNTGNFCDDANVCTADSCLSTGCVSTPVPNGTACDDNDLCDGRETCVNGACTPGLPPVCPADGDVCTQDCHPGRGCLHTPICIPPVCGCGSSGGDPHFLTWNHAFYNFQGAGEYVLATDQDAWTIQVRQTPWPSHASVTVNTAVATMVGNSRVTYYAGSGLRVDGIPTAIGPSGLQLPGGGRIDPLGGSIILISYSGGEFLGIQDQGSYLNLGAYHRFPPARPLRGLLSGEILTPPVSFNTLYHDFGDGLRITQQESLFDYSPGEGTETFTDLSFPTRAFTTNELDPDVYNGARDICVASGITDPYLLDACIFDIGITGDPSFAQWGATVTSTITPTVTAFDVDHDLVIDSEDNCMLTSNPDQTNEDGDKCGDECDSSPGDEGNCGPFANAGPDQTVGEGSLVTLDGSASSDPDGDPLSFQWSAPTGIILSDSTIPRPTFQAPLVGPGGMALAFGLVVNDGEFGSAPATVRIAVANVNDPPVCDAARANPDLLWPPNHKLVPVGIVGVTDPNEGDAPTITVTGVTQDEPVNGVGDGNAAPDAVVSEGTLLLRAERDGRGNGRVYRVSFAADDGKIEGRCTGSVTVCVPHDQKTPSCTDDGRSHDSTVSAR